MRVINQQLSENAIRWLASGKRGISSNTMFTVIAGVEATAGWYFNHPLDPDDFGRCEKLLREVPEFREKLKAMNQVSDVWRELVEHWDKIVSLMEEEAPGIFDGKHGECQKAFEFMKSLGC